MSTFDVNLYSLITTTNMHVGSGKNNYGIIDNLIQRDIITDYPTINSSSLKGALREFFEDDSDNKDMIRYVFGSEPKDDGQGTNAPGKYRFFSAHLLSMPVRSNTQPFLNITCEAAINGMLTSLKEFGLKHNDEEVLKNWMACLGNAEAMHFIPDAGEVIAEAMDMEVQSGSFAQIDRIEQIIGKYPVLVSNERFKELTNDNHLPVISRNYLENGISKNLWYEQVLPRQSRVYFIVLSPKGGL